jgi:hypothetical protein
MQARQEVNSLITMQPSNYQKSNPRLYSADLNSHEVCKHFFAFPRESKKKWPLVFNILRETSI